MAQWKKWSYFCNWLIDGRYAQCFPRRRKKSYHVPKQTKRLLAVSGFRQSWHRLALRIITWHTTIMFGMNSEIQKCRKLVWFSTVLSAGRKALYKCSHLFCFFLSVLIFTHVRILCISHLVTEPLFNPKAQVQPMSYITLITASLERKSTSFFIYCPWAK